MQTQALRDHQQVTFVTLNRFCLLSKKNPPTFGVFPTRVWEESSHRLKICSFLTHLEKSPSRFKWSKLLLPRFPPPGKKNQPQQNFWFPQPLKVTWKTLPLLITDNIKVDGIPTKSKWKITFCQCSLTYKKGHVFIKNEKYSFQYSSTLVLIRAWNHNLPISKAICSTVITLIIYRNVSKTCLSL